MFRFLALAATIILPHAAFAQGLGRDTRVATGSRSFEYARVFSEMPQGEVFWYENSLGLVEIAGNACSAARQLGLAVGQRAGYCA